MSCIDRRIEPAIVKKLQGYITDTLPYCFPMMLEEANPKTVWIGRLKGLHLRHNIVYFLSSEGPSKSCIHSLSHPRGNHCHAVVDTPSTLRGEQNLKMLTKSPLNVCMLSPQNSNRILDLLKSISSHVLSGPNVEELSVVVAIHEPISFCSLLPSSVLHLQ
jgi:hypothetical protein